MQNLCSRKYLWEMVNRMDNYNLVVEHCRFHISKPNTMIFIGWFREDNPDNREVEVYFDGKKLEVEYVIQKGIEVRQKYLSKEANVSEEIRASFMLPNGWNKKGNLIIYSCINGKKDVSMKMTSKQLIKLNGAVKYVIERYEKTNGHISIFGWAVADGVVNISLFQNKKEINAEVIRGYRKDVIAVYEDISNRYMAGFRIEADIENHGGICVHFNAGEKSSKHTIAGKKNASKTGIIRKAWTYFRQKGLLNTMKRTAEYLEKKVFSKAVTAEMRYKRWRKKYEVTMDELKKEKVVKFDYEPLISFVVPLYDTKPEYLCELIESIQNQTYSNWELCFADGTGENTPLKGIVEKYSISDKRIKYQILTDNKGISENTNAAIRMATGDLIVFSDHDDIVASNALYECVKALNEDKSIDVLYSDEDKIDMKGKTFFEPHFKSDLNLDLLCSMNYICHLFVVKKDVIDKVGMLRSEFDGAQDHDFILRCVEVAQNVKHIPKILYHWRCHMNSTAANPESKMYAFEAGRRAVEEHYKRLGIPATVEHGQFYGMYKTKYLWKEKPLISIIIPNKDHIEDLQKIMNSIDEKSTYRNYEFVIVENNSTEEETFAFYKEIENRVNVQVLYYDGSFNYSKINNFGVSKAKGEYLLLLNNDTEIINPECLEEMLGVCMREDVGIVGARLYYDDDTIQHAGVVLGFGGMAGHTFIGQSRYDNGYFSRIICTQDYTAVTAACMMTKRSVYEFVGGLSEEFEVAFNDIDYCMKVRALGKLVVYNPAVELYHYESKSRGSEDTPEKVERFNSEVARFIEKWHEELEAGDPYYNPNLTLDKADFSLIE